MKMLHLGKQFLTGTLLPPYLVSLQGSSTAFIPIKSDRHRPRVPDHPLSVYATQFHGGKSGTIPCTSSIHTSANFGPLARADTRRSSCVCQLSGMDIVYVLP